MGDNKRFEAIVITVLYLFTLYIWTLPFQENRLPYGEVDAGSHFTLGDYMGETDKPLYTLPYFIDVRYGYDNYFTPHHLWYHPPYHVNFAIMQIIGGERVLPIFLFNAILCSLIVPVTYFFIRKLFGFWQALIASLLMVFSMRDILIYLWGQWPQQISYFYTPVVLYAFYKYADSYLNNEPKPVYAYLFAILLGTNFYLHPVGSFHTIIALGLFCLFLAIKEKKIPFSIKHISIAVLIFTFMLAIFPLQTASVFVQMKGGSAQDKAASPLYHDFGSLFSWFSWKDYYANEIKTQPAPYFNYKDMNGGYWTLPFLFIGLLFLIYRRKRKDLLMLAYLFSIYSMIHLAILGTGRPERSLAATAHIFYPLIAIGIVSLPLLVGTILRLPSHFKAIIKYTLILLAIILVFSFNFSMPYSTLKTSYSSISRITPIQYEASVEIRDKTPENANISTVGVLMMQKDRWMRFVSWRFVYPYSPTAPAPTHMLFDYSDFAAIGDKSRLQQIAAFEKNISSTGQLIYSKDNMIKVYKLD